MAELWHLKPVGTVVKELGTHRERGLSHGEAAQRLKRLGPNRLVEGKKISPLALFVNQFKDFMVLVLLVSTGVSALLGEVVDALAILAIVLLNAVLSFVQEYRAERSLEALKKLTAPHCKVVRDGEWQKIPAHALVPGDLVILEAGDRVPADGRLVSANSLSVDESTLTGESVPTSKHSEPLSSPNLTPADQKNMVFMGTLVTRGVGSAVITATGMDTEMGRIAHLIQDTTSLETPLQRRLSQLGKALIAGCLLIVAAVFAAGVWKGFPIYKMFMVGVTLAVAAIPEGLPAVVTIALAVGVQRMARRSAIVRQLPAVETLGCATVICSDKTGTLTQNRMTAQRVWVDEGVLDVRDGKGIQGLAKASGAFQRLLRVCALCTHAQAHSNKEVVGDPTEAALLRLALQGGVNQARLKSLYPVVREVPFDSERKRMAALVEGKEGLQSLVKGAPDIILRRCSHVRIRDQVIPLNPLLRQNISAQLEGMTAQALRVLACAEKAVPGPNVPDTYLEQGLTFLGLVGLMDPPRPEARQAIATARKAGIRTIMVTGDHKQTAAAIGAQLGLLTPEAPQILTGTEWESLSEREQQREVQRTAVFARVTPAHKLSIVKALKANGEIVAMTGDGVNDAPAVREADIGISMGIQGTDVTREASAMVLTDDNYATIVNAVGEGRGIYDNIRKFIRYLLACNVGEVLTMFVATLGGLPLPLIPIQILWMNLVTDGLPAIALGLDSAEEDIMERPPRSPKEGVFARRLHLKILFTGVVISACTLAVFLFSLWYYPGDVLKARTLAFTTLVSAQLVYVFQCRSEKHSIFELGLWGNLPLVGAVLVSGGMHAAILYHPALQEVFQTTGLSLDDWLLVLVFAMTSLFLDTLWRMLKTSVRKHFSMVKV